MLIPRWVQIRLATFALRCLISAFESSTQPGNGSSAFKKLLEDWDWKRRLS